MLVSAKWDPSTAQNHSLRMTGWLGVGLEEAPGFLISGVFGFGAVGGEEDLGLTAGGGEGNEVPDFEGDHIGRDEVEFVESVGRAV